MVKFTSSGFYLLKPSLVKSASDSIHDQVMAAKVRNTAIIMLHCALLDQCYVNASQTQR